MLICVTKVIDGLRLGDWRAVCERAVGFGDKGQVLVVLGLECRLAPFSHLKPTLVVVGVVCMHAHTDKILTSSLLEPKSLHLIKGFPSYQLKLKK